MFTVPHQHFYSNIYSGQITLILEGLGHCYLLISCMNSCFFKCSAEHTEHLNVCVLSWIRTTKMYACSWNPILIAMHVIE